MHVEDSRTLLLPDRRGNNRIDSLRNIISCLRVALIFLLHGNRAIIRSGLWSPEADGAQHMAQIRGQEVGLTRSNAAVETAGTDDHINGPVR